jgi:flagellar biosynthesis/type III secretory pathway protein FliH
MKVFTTSKRNVTEREARSQEVEEQRINDWQQEKRKQMSMQCGWLAGYEERREKKGAKYDTQTLLLWVVVCVCVCMCSSLKNACARKEKVKKNANVPCHFFCSNPPV